MSALDTTEQVMAVAWENYRREVGIEVRELRTERDAALKVIERWEPQLCSAFGCQRYVPTPAQVDQFRSLGATWDESKGFAWMAGFCSAACVERDAEETNVLPFVPREVAP